ncbi:MULTISPECIES: glycosyltransferase [Parabacteroides]|jgi:glycosyltransferase, family 1|uniref:glycosyltransferase n=2 Tax=Tannerellaceae TaxID=2005525 RepID=UPI000EFF270C|nr:glycosyltransferase [Parabacteroides sp. AF18-52]RHR40998.1 glycosyltransferase [Parabacteroides sp. AF18-52]
MKNKKLLIIGSIPKGTKEIGGVTILTKNLLDYLDKAKIKYSFLQLNKTCHNILNYIYILIFSIPQIISCDIIVANMSNNSALYVYPYICFWCNLFNKKIVFRKFGGNYDKTYCSYSGYKKKIIDLSLRHSDLLLFESFHLTNFFKKLFPETTVMRFPNCRSKGDIPTNKIYSKRFVYIGSVKKEKGIREILNCSRHLNDSYTLDIYGPLDGDIPMEDFQNTNVTYKGVLPPWQVRKALTSYDVLLLPTYYEGEGYPGIIIEAFSVDIPVIATEWNAIPEIVTNMYNGLLIPVKDENALLEAIKKMNDVHGILEKNISTYFNQNFNSDIINPLIINRILSC